MAKKKKVKVDGLSADDLKKISSAVRKVWSWSHPRKLAKARATDEEGFFFCEKCFKTVSKVHVDHVDAVGEVGGPNYIQRMWCPSRKLQILCYPCHGKKTRGDLKKIKLKKLKKKR